MNTYKNSQLKEIYNKTKLHSNIIISLKNVGKKYVIHHEKPTLIENIGKKILGQRKEEFWALKNINLDINKGEKVGFYGPNGSGKTTLLKIISKITTPTEGTILTKGNVVSLIDLESGFHPDLSGYENIVLSGMILGMAKKQIKQNIKKIINFADIGNFISAPLYTYSNGMRLRLGFSIAVNSNPDILILDEVFSVGDENFRKKSQKILNKLFKKEKTILMASHWLEYLKKNCNRLIYISHIK